MYVCEDEKEINDFDVMRIKLFFYYQEKDKQVSSVGNYLICFPTNIGEENDQNCFNLYRLLMEMCARGMVS